MFATEEFIRQYKNLSNPDRAISQEANQYILRLQQSNEAFQIAKQLLEQPIVQQEYLFIACQLIYRRLKEECDISIQPYLLQLLQKDLPPIALNQVCSSFAVIIVGNPTLWDNILADIVQLMQTKMALGIEILSQIAIQGKEWYRKGEQLRMQQAFVNQEDKLSQIFTSLLQIQNVEILSQSITCIEYWVQFAYNLFKDQKLISLLISLIQQATQSNAIDFTEKLYALLSEGVIFSQYNRAQNIQMLEPIVVQNLGMILEFILKIYNPQQSKGYASFATKFICDFQVIVINTPLEQEIFKLMTNLIQNPSRKIAFQTFDFWSQMREQNKLQEHGLNILQTMIDKCRMKSIKLTKEFLQGEAEEDDEEYSVKYCEGGQQFISTSDFREHSKDIFYCIYKSAEQAQQTDKYFHIVLQNINLSSHENSTQIIQIESALFSLCSIIDEADIRINNQIVLQIIGVILNLQIHNNFDIIAKTALQMFSEFTNQLQFSFDILLQITRYFFKYMLHPLLGPLAGVAYEQICNLEDFQSQELISEALLFFQQNFCQFINQQQVSNFIDGLIKQCYRFYTKGNIDQMIQLFEFANNQFQKISEVQNERQFIYCITLVTSILSWVNLNVESIHGQIKKLSEILCSSIVQPLMHLIKTQQKLSDYDEIYKLIRIVIKVSNYETQSQSIIDMLTFSLLIFSQDPIKKSFWLQLVTEAIGRSSEHQFICQWAQINGPKIDEFCLEQYRCWKDPDLMKVYVEYVKEGIRSFHQLILNSPLLIHIIECICDAFTSLNSYEMQREIMHFYRTLVKFLDGNCQNFSQIIMKVIQTLFLTISEINPALVYQIVQILYDILEKNINPNDLQQLIFQSLSQGWGKDKDSNKVKLVSQAIVCYLLRNQPTQEPRTLSRDLKLLLQNLRPGSEAEINYMQLELTVKRR